MSLCEERASAQHARKIAALNCTESTGRSAGRYAWDVAPRSLIAPGFAADPYERCSARANVATIRHYGEDES